MAWEAHSSAVESEPFGDVDVEDGEGDREASAGFEDSVEVIVMVKQEGTGFHIAAPTAVFDKDALARAGIDWRKLYEALVKRAAEILAEQQGIAVNDLLDNSALTHAGPHAVTAFVSRYHASCRRAERRAAREERRAARQWMREHAAEVAAGERSMLSGGGAAAGGAAGAAGAPEAAEPAAPEERESAVDKKDRLSKDKKRNERLLAVQSGWEL